MSDMSDIWKSPFLKDNMPEDNNVPVVATYSHTSSLGMSLGFFGIQLTRPKERNPLLMLRYDIRCVHLLR